MIGKLFKNLGAFGIFKDCIVTNHFSFLNKGELIIVLDDSPTLIWRHSEHINDYERQILVLTSGGIVGFIKRNLKDLEEI